MALTTYEPWALVNQLQREMNRLFEGREGRGGETDGSVATSDWIPAVDIRDEPNRFIILADVPGVDVKDIEVQMENGMLSIKGERKHEAREEREGYKRVERTRGSFYRRFTLPDTADNEKIAATCKNGVLEVVIPKQEKVQPRRISVEG